MSDRAENSKQAELLNRLVVSPRFARAGMDERHRLYDAVEARAARLARQAAGRN